MFLGLYPLVYQRKGWLGGWGFWATVLIAVKRMTIYICAALPGGLRALGGVLFASSLPNYILMLDDQIKAKEKETYRRTLTMRKGGGAAWPGPLGGCAWEGHEGQLLPTVSSPQAAVQFCIQLPHQRPHYGLKLITPFLKQSG